MAGLEDEVPNLRLGALKMLLPSNPRREGALEIGLLKFDGYPACTGNGLHLSFSLLIIDVKFIELVRFVEWEYF